MNSSVVLRQFLRGIIPGSNGVQNHLNAFSHVSRAFAVVPIRDASSLSSKKNSALQPLIKLLPEVQQVRSSSSDVDYVKHWTAERVLSIVLLGAIPAAIVIPSPSVEAFLALSLTVHSHWGIEALVHDYVRPSMFGDKIPVLCVGLVYGLSVMTLGSLLYFIYSDVGIINAVSMLWKIG